jgi:molecular chaperone HtpG
MAESGHISIHAENILPIIKRWLYSEKDIFLRELVSNAADALTKLHKLSLVGEAKDIPVAKISVAIDEEAKTLTITDTGLGMTADEVKKYINQVAFSGLSDFVEKYKDKDDSNQVIGHFGLGFYSSFMIATKVEIDTLSFRDGSKPVRWSCDGSTEFVLSDSERKEVGTSIIIHVDEESKEMLNKQKISGLLNKYCAFIRYPISMDGEDINEPTPLWTKNASSLKDEDYLEFFRKNFPGNPDPLFWIHLNLDYPFALKGILYFPKIQHELDASQGEVKLFCNQVYVADNSKELIPEFLTLLKGAIDCPDLPLNVSRSYLQTDPTVMKISEHITKKVADKLAGMAKTDRENYEKYWGDIHPFVKFGMMRDKKFYDRMIPHLIYKSSKGGYTELGKYLENNKDKTEEKTILYASDETAQASFLTMFKEQDIECVIADTQIDAHLIPQIEMHSAGEFKFVRVDSNLSDQLIDETKSEIVDKEDKTISDKVKAVFEKFSTAAGMQIRVESFKTNRIPAILIEDENMRRMKEFSSMSGIAAFDAQLNGGQTLVLNEKNPAIKNILSLSGTKGKEQQVELMVAQINDLAQLQQGNFTPELMQSFIDRSSTLLGAIGNDAPLENVAPVAVGASVNEADSSKKETASSPKSKKEPAPTVEG